MKKLLYILWRILFRILLVLCLIILYTYIFNFLYDVIFYEFLRPHGYSFSIKNNPPSIIEITLILWVIWIIYYFGFWPIYRKTNSNRLELWLIKSKPQFRWEKISKIKKFNLTVQFILRITIFLFLLILNALIFKVLYELIDKYIVLPNCLWIWHYHCVWFYWWHAMDILENFETIYSVVFVIFTIWLTYYFLWSDIKKIWDIRKIRIYHIKSFANKTKQLIKNSFKKNKKEKLIILLLLWLILSSIFLLKNQFVYKQELKNISIDEYNFWQLEKVKKILSKWWDWFYDLESFNEKFNADIKPINNCYFISDRDIYFEDGNWGWWYIFWFELLSNKYVEKYWKPYYAYPKYDLPPRFACTWYSCDFEVNFSWFIRTITNLCKD